MKDKKINIGLNATCFDERASGAKNRFVGIYSHIFLKLKNCNFYVYHAKSINMSSWFHNNLNVNFIETNIPSEGRIRKYLVSYIYWIKENKIKKFDIFESFHLPLIKNKANYNILTIHDLRFLNVNFFLTKYIYFLIFKNSLNNTNKVITVSNFIKKELSKFINYNKIINIYNGYSPIKNNNIVKINSTKIQIDKKIILSVGHFEKRKNFQNLIKAYNSNDFLKENYELIIIGNDNGYKSQLDKLISKLKIKNNVKLLLNISDELLNFYYQNSCLFVFPSSYEGFGIPIIEAMYYELPIVASNIDVIKEISDNSLLYFEYNNHLDISAKIETLLKSPDIKNNQIKKFKHILKKYNYENIANQLINLYKHLD